MREGTLTIIMISVNMRYCAVIRNDDGTVDKVLDSNGAESQLFINIAKHPLIDSKEAALDIFKNKFSKVIESKADKTQGFFGDVVTGNSEKFVPAKPYTYRSSFNDSQEAFRKNYDTHKGKFDEHIATSIPMFRDTQVKKGAAIVATVGQGTMIDIGGSEGGFAKAVTQTSNGAIKTINLEPQKDMADSHRRTEVEGALVIEQPFLTPVGDKAPYKPNQKVEAVHESMVFQFITPQREAFVKEVKENYLTEDGVFITEEKFRTNEEDYQKNEKIKNTLHKSQYYTQEQLAMKAEGVLVGMKKNQVSLAKYVKILKDNFEYVGIYWSSGNFKGIIATDSKQKFDTFMETIGDTSSEFSTNERITEQGKITRKPIRVNKSLIDLQKPNISFIFADNSTLINSEDARENRNIQDQLEQEADDLQNLVNCLWG